MARSTLFLVLASVVLAASFGATTAHAVDVNETTYSTLLRILGETNLDEVEDDQRARFPFLTGANWERSAENSHGRASGSVHATVTNGDRLEGRVQLQTTGQWNEVPIAQFDESRAEYSISFFAPTAIRIDLAGVLNATQTSEARIFIDAFDDGRYWEPFRVNDNPVPNHTTIRPGDPADTKTIDETIVLDALTSPTGVYRLYFWVYGDSWNELPQDANMDVSFSITAIPEPGTALLLGLGLATLSARRAGTRGSV